MPVVVRAVGFGFLFVRSNMNPNDLRTPGDLLVEIDRLRDHVLDRVNVMLEAPLPPERRAEVVTRRFRRASSALSVLQYAADTLREVKLALEWIEDEATGRPHRDEVGPVSLQAVEAPVDGRPPR